MNPLPPFAALRAFEAAVRHLSFKKAASELGLTPTAISHQIKRLETEAKTNLFRRHVRSISLTSSGERFAQKVAPALDTIRSAYLELNASRQSETVVISAGPVFSSRWLAPRLSELAAAHPEIDLRLHYSPSDFPNQSSEVDIAIVWGRGDWPDAQSRKLLELNITPVLAPDLAAEHGPIQTAQDLLRMPLLHQRDSEAWRSWFADRGLQMTEPKGATFEDANVLWQAALFGQGAMLGYVEFIQDDLRSDRLLKPLEDVTSVSEAYYLVTTENAISSAASKVMEWLLR